MPRRPDRACPRDVLPRLSCGPWCPFPLSVRGGESSMRARPSKRMLGARERRKFMGFLRVLMYLFGAWLAFWLIASGFHTIRHGFVGVGLVNVGDKPELDEVLDPGWYWRRPFVVDMQEFPTTEQVLEHQL